MTQLNLLAQVPDAKERGHHVARAMPELLEVEVVRLRLLEAVVHDAPGRCTPSAVSNLSARAAMVAVGKIYPMTQTKSLL